MVSTASSQVYLRLWVCTCDAQQNRLIIPVLPVRSVPKTSSPYDDVHPQVPVCREWFLAINLVNISEPLRRAGDRLEKRLVLIHLRPGSGTGAFVSGVYSTSTALQQGHPTATCSSIPTKRLPTPTNSASGVSGSADLAEGMRWLLPLVGSYSEPWRTP